MQQTLTTYNYPTKMVEEIDGVVFSSDFDSGNLGSAKKDSTQLNTYLITIKEDSGQNGKTTNYRTWFYFSVKGVPVTSIITFTITNMGNQVKLFREGMSPVFRAGLREWQRVKLPVSINQPNVNGQPVELTFRHLFDEAEETFFAFTYPWSNEDNEKYLVSHELKLKSNKDIYFHRTSLINSIEKRKVELITISSSKYKEDKREDGINNLFPEGNLPNLFGGRKNYIFVSARVHPGELPSSFVLNGLIDMLLDQNNRNSEIARDNFVWVLVPIINPDGVYRGHYRTDSWCQNLNRYYTNPSVSEHPPVYAIKEYLMKLHQTERLYAYIDLHAHAAQKGVFIYGNSLTSISLHTTNCLFPRLLSFYSEIFDYEGCNFTEKNMHAADKSDGLSKDGAGRVAIYKATNLTHSYTLECNYNTGRTTNKLCDQTFMQPDRQFYFILPEIADSYGSNKIDLEGILNTSFYNTIADTYFYKISDFELVGSGIVNSFLDLNLLNIASRIPKNQLHTLNNVKLQLSYNIMKQLPYRMDPFVRKIVKNLSSKEQLSRTLSAFQVFVDTGNIIDTFEGDAQIIPVTRYQKAQEVKQKKELNKVKTIDKQAFEYQNAKQELGPLQQNTRLFVMNGSSLDEKKIRSTQYQTSNPDKKLVNGVQIKVQNKNQKLLPRANSLGRRVTTPSRVEFLGKVQAKPPVSSNQFRIKQPVKKT